MKPFVYSYSTSLQGVFISGVKEFFLTYWNGGRTTFPGERVESKEFRWAGMF